MVNEEVTALVGVAVAVALVGSMLTATSVISEQTTSYDTVSEENLFEFQNLTNEEVTIELLNNSETEEIVSGTLENGEIQANLSSNQDVDQLEISTTGDKSNIVEVTHYYDYDGTTDGEGDTANYGTDHAYSTFEESSMVEGQLADWFGIFIVGLIGAGIVLVMG